MCHLLELFSNLWTPIGLPYDDVRRTIATIQVISTCMGYCKATMGHALASGRRDWEG
jgi:hypothetical protein